MAEAWNRLVSAAENIDWNQITVTQYIRALKELIHSERLVVGQPVEVEKFRHLIENKSTASGGEIGKGSAVPGVHSIHRDLGKINGAVFRRSLCDFGSRVSFVRPDDYPIRSCDHN